MAELTVLESKLNGQAGGAGHWSIVAVLAQRAGTGRNRRSRFSRVRLPGV
jgi:hypothetical protein